VHQRLRISSTNPGSRTPEVKKTSIDGSGVTAGGGTDVNVRLPLVEGPRVYRSAFRQACDGSCFPQAIRVADIQNFRPWHNLTSDWIEYRLKGLADRRSPAKRQDR
jgi:hypothetical protein